jgi:hypothetical protein
MHTARNIVVSLAVIAGSFLGAFGIVPVASALDCTGADKDSAACQVENGVGKVGGDNNTTSLTTFITNLTNILFFVAGAIAVVMIILGGIRYITSNGDQAHVKAAKDTIMYSVVGLVVAILAYAIVRFIVMNIK